MGKFEKGNPGKPKGAKNKVTSELREKFEQLLETVTVEKMAEDLLELKPAERLNVIMSLAEYITPKLARTQMEHAMPDLPPIKFIEVKCYESPIPLANSEKDVVL